MEDNELFSAAINHSSFDEEGLDVLPLITKERTQRFELLLHLIPNLKQHIILLGASGIGKTLLLDMLYDIDSEAWQCCFVQGNADLSFETVEAQLSKTMLRNKHASLDGALQMFREQHKKIVLIIDDAGLLVPGLMTTLIEYAASQSAIKLIFSLTPEARNNHRKTDKALDDCYLLELPKLSKRQCAYFLRHLAAKPRTYSAIPIDEKLLDKLYRDTHGIPAKLISDFTKLSRKNENDHLKWVAGFIGLVFLAAAINQAVRYFNEETVDEIAVSPVEKIEAVKSEPVEKMPAVQAEKVPESQAKPEQDIVIPEFKLDIEQKLNSTTPVTPQSETVAPPVEKTPESVPASEPAKTEAEKVEPDKTSVPQTTPEVKTIAPQTESIPEPAKTNVEPEKVVEPVVAFPKIAPAKGMKIQPLPEKETIKAVPISTPEVKKVNVEPVKKVEIKPVEKPAAVKKPVVEKIESVKIEPVKKVELKSTPEVKETAKIDTKIEPVLPPDIKRYALQLITLSSEAAVQAFQKKHADMAKNTRVVKSGTPEQPRFGVIYGGFSSSEEAAKAREKLPAEFANALPRKMTP